MSLLVEGKRRQADNDHNDRAWTAWTTAALYRAKRIPPLKNLLAKKKKSPTRRVMSADAMLTMARIWSAVAGPEGGKA